MMKSLYEVLASGENSHYESGKKSQLASGEKSHN